MKLVQLLLLQGPLELLLMKCRELLVPSSNMLPNNAGAESFALLAPTSFFTATKLVQ